MANAFVNAPGEITAQLTDYIVSARWTDLPDGRAARGAALVRQHHGLHDRRRAA